MKVIRNTYPTTPGVAHAEPGDEVAWVLRPGKLLLVRNSDGRTVFSRDSLPKGQTDERPVCGVIAEVKSKGQRLEIG